MVRGLEYTGEVGPGQREWLLVTCYLEIPARRKTEHGLDVPAVVPDPIHPHMMAMSSNRRKLAADTRLVMQVLLSLRRGFSFINFWFYFLIVPELRGWLRV